MSDEKPTTSREKETAKEDEKEKRKEERSPDEEHDESSLGAVQTHLLNFFKKLTVSSDEEDGPQEKVIDDLTVDGLITHWKTKGFKNIITMVGAGISTSAGIPDFRSPGSGLYHNLKKYNLPHPTAVFEMDYFNENPQPFFALAKELYPGTFNPTLSHYFVRLLHEKGLLLRHYTQNIDTLERIAGIPDKKLVEAHGTFYTNHCLSCKKLYSMQWMKEQIFSDCVPTCTRCNSVVKPDIVFFGENLPEKFYSLPPEDFKKCDLLIIMGTSLEVQPFASLVDHAGPKCVRLLINREKVGHSESQFSMWFMGPSLLFDSENNTRDIALIGNCDDGVRRLADGLGWDKELNELMQSEHKRLAKSNEESAKDLEKLKKVKPPKTEATKDDEEKSTTDKLKQRKQPKGDEAKDD